MIDKDKMLKVVADVELNTVKRAMHLGLVFGLRKLGCTYSALKDMADREDFWSDDHARLWYGVGVLADPKLVEWATYTLDAGGGADAFGSEVNDNQHSDDVLTGEPHHLIVNGDHGGCACGGHLLSCTTWDDPEWKHKHTICGLRRAGCLHHPAHKYNEPCDNYSKFQEMT